MKKQFFYITFFLIFFLGGIIQVSAQGELPKEPIKIEGINTKKDNNTGLMELFKLPPSNANSMPDLNEKRNFMMREQFLDPGTQYKRKSKKPDAENTQAGATTNQFLGDFRSNGKFVKIVCRDHQYVDGDRVRIFMNDKVVQPNVLLDASYRGIYVDLVPGFNKIDFQALNQGSSGPNTAALAVFDDQGNVISVKEWNLATGVKATMIIVKED
ncbi:hypothetical protein E7Z59_09565 [Robertkochia marina]|uniref:Secreted protein n=1 Tax=Robertkochia marina TaxID=1227945 RepID=A0A4S3M1H3_9FLAO|nr:hypothetical protein [Robertkochia marina]THD67887.1 hypothetical protein E7Z59_09565 [Robertkochia marina]TRZ42074.1 hypothetical protein D3A96_12150 [Robertkochia marina]